MTDTHLETAVAQVNAAIAAKRQPVVRTFFDEATFTATHVVHDPETKHAAVIDSVLDFDQPSGRTTHDSADAVIAYVRAEGLTVDWLLETHAHADHLSDAPYIQQELGGTLVIGSEIRTVQDVFAKVFNEPESFVHDGSQFDRLMHDGERFSLGGIDAVALHVPGHTPACLAYVIGDAVFVGDTLFMPDYGTARADFPGGDARTLFRSIRRLMQLPDATRVFLCHDYKAPGRDDYVWETTIGAEKSGNVHVHDGVTEDEFVAMREARDATLGMPRLILPSIQVNIRAGHFPEPEANGVSYLKLPLNLL
ncbi:MBL fold metallo-hydrolase [Novosphingobium album (ex Hu et al. 2023)]|uniref:MBL fold metallo-hydrolase n=1 Tax=Novosphingobium album (ex Hu et al. 2023) TaxID=2930093 RepID=A0ABT0AWF1_9SPHN|nr:MBL fold metallo-hydrolase [Novosphingobium album (ex Hu et al. 2023)]MCJ2176943.1 MBL fold metallo-hydrolase [Novosphingobium album (ex Hu et al. 2023)]